MKKDNERYYFFYICLNDQISTFASQKQALWRIQLTARVQTNSQPAPELAIFSANVKCYGLGFKKTKLGPLSPLNQQLYENTASRSAAVGIVDEPCWEIDWGVSQDVCVLQGSAVKNARVQFFLL